MWMGLKNKNRQNQLFAKLRFYLTNILGENRHTIQIMKDFSFLFTLGFQSSLVKMKTASETTTSTLKRSPLSKSWKVGKREEEFYDCFLLSLHNNLRAKKGKNGVQKEKRSYLRKNKCEFIQTISPCLN